MVQTFTHEEPSSFETLGSQFSVLGVVGHTSFNAKMDWPNLEYYLDDRTPWI